MSRRAKLAQLAPVLLAATATGAPAALADGGSGGTGISPSGSYTPPPVTTPASSAPLPSGPGVVQATGNGISFSTDATALLRGRLSFTGHVSGATPGETVEIERRGRQTHWRWAPTTHGAVARNGSFSATWPTNHIGRFEMRAVLETVRGSASRATPSPALTITVYRPSLATTFGPGFFGSRTACGQILEPGTLGVAHRTLPCGTRVALLWHGRTLTVPVIDRGPYANGADWDLTSATAAALGINGTETIGAVSLRH